MIHDVRVCMCLYTCLRLPGCVCLCVKFAYGCLILTEHIQVDWFYTNIHSRTTATILIFGRSGANNVSLYSSFTAPFYKIFMDGIIMVKT